MSWIQDVLGHPAVINHGNGTDPEDLASFQEVLADLGRYRILTVGDEQYGGEVQRFEEITLHQTAAEFLEEVADAMNYMAMAAAKALAQMSRIH